jgi:quinol monooxygenase YgiN
MKPLLRLLVLGAAMLGLGAVQDARAQNPGDAAVYAATYIEVMPAAKDKAAALLRELGAAGRTGAGNLRFEVLQRRDRPNHFAIVEVWTDQKARDASAAAAPTKQFRAALKPLLSSAYDERPHTGLAVGSVAAGAAAQGAAVYVVTHVDIIPPKKDDGVAALRQLAGPSRQEAGNLRYEVWQQSSRPNHFTLVEIWKDQGALEGHEVAAHTKTFRELLLPMSGSLYDQRLYKALD